ncbi:MAG: DNA polymerase I [Bacilli bacterium]|nr:DNA polymerase I [Bacilli bacterium]
MNKVILIDGNNLLFRSYYATAYSGNMMRNSKGFPTNALFGFVNMLNKIIKEEKPAHILVALDKGKTFRHDSYADYKAGRMATPDDLNIQFGVAKTILDNMGIKYFEIDGYEADDIIGTLSTIITNTQNYEAKIISSDKDLLQLINDKVEVKLLKTKDFIKMDKNAFIKEYGFEPIKIIDLKGLQGDPSDNIPGVKGIGEKTAFKLIKEYHSIEGIYVNIDKIEGKLKEKLLNDKENAFMSKQLATIYKEVPLDITLDDIIYNGENEDELTKVYEELEFYSFLKNRKQKEQVKENIIIVKESEEFKIDKDKEIAIYLEILGSNYHTGEILGMGIYDGLNSFYIPLKVLKKNPNILKDNPKITYNIKKTLVALKYKEVNLNNFTFDTMLAAYLLNYNIKDDISYLSNQLGYDIPFYEAISKSRNLTEDLIANLCAKKAKFIYETKARFEEELNKEEVMELFNNIEMPLTYVLSDMEYTGVNINKNIFKDMSKEIEIKMELLTNNIYNYAGCTFNIMSPKQLGDVLFNKMQIPYKGSSKKANFETSKDILYKIKDKHPIINNILEYKMLSKIYGNYIRGMLDYVLADGKIHTIFNQTLTRTGRLSSMEPNLQNIPIRYEYGRLIRKAFIPSKNNILMSSDYSQIELRIFAHMSKEANLIEAFNNGMDIHTKTAMDVFKVEKSEVNSEMRRQAKAVNFGILYGISSFGLSEDLDIDIREAKQFIDAYLETFPGIKKYMTEVINKAKEDGYVKTIMNRKRMIEELSSNNYIIKQQGERMALNTPIQGSSADIIKKAMVEIYNKFNDLKLKSKMIIQVHDELIFDVVKEEKEKVAKIVEDIMENTYKLDVPIKADINFGDNWYQAK